MKHIAILSCIHSIRVCTAASCLKCFNEKRRGFAVYENVPVQLDALCYCNGCDKDPETDAGMIEKLDRLQEIGVETVHTGLCTKDKNGEYCPNIQKIINMLHDRGIQVVHGTH